MKKLIWLKLFLAFSTLPMWARCGFKTDYVTVGTATVTNATSPNASLKLFVQPLPINGGIGPQINTINLWGRTSVESGLEGSFDIMASTDEPSLASGGAPDPAKTFSAFYMRPYSLSWQLNDGNDPSLATSSFYFDSTGLNVLSTLTVTNLTTVSTLTVTEILGPGNRLNFGAGLSNLENNTFRFHGLANNCDFTWQEGGLGMLVSGASTFEASDDLVTDLGGASTRWTHVYGKTIVGDTLHIAGGGSGAVSAASGDLAIGTLSAANGGTGASSYANGQMLFGVSATGGLNVSTMSGTTNRVTVTASTFNVTLSLPQDINTTSTPQFSALGLATPGGTAQTLKLSNGTTSRAPINFNNGGSLKTTPASGDFEVLTDDVYYVIQTGTARKNFVLADAALTTGGHIPYTTTNGRVQDSATLAYNGTRLLIGNGSGQFGLVGGGKPATISNGDMWYDTTLNRFQAAQQSSTQTFATLQSSQTFTGAQNVSSMNVVTSGNLYSGGALIGLAISTYSDSGSYNFGTTTNTIAISNSSSTVTLTSSGTYRIDGMVNMRYNGATFAANQFVTVNLYRQNNTPGVIANSQSQEELQISVGALTNQFGQFNLPPVFYTTTNTNDIISLHGSISATPGAGSFQATEASVVAQRLY